MCCSKFPEYFAVAMDPEVTINGQAYIMSKLV